MTGVVDLATYAAPRSRHLAACEVELGHHRCSFEEWTPDQGRIFERFLAIDVETTRIDDENPQIIPAMVVATACDGQQGCSSLGRRCRPSSRLTRVRG